MDDLIAAAERAPDDVDAQVRAAYACDRNGDEARAVTFYDAAWRLGVTGTERSGFLLGYGSTLKNVGRLDESETILRLAIAEAPDDRALRLFLALTLHAAARHDEALASALEVGLMLAPAAPDIARFERALSEYRDILLASAGANDRA